MEINDLRIFQGVAYEKSISKAAKKLGYAQSNVTMRIKVLENELNTSLFIRNNNGTTLTPSGEKLLCYADKIIKLVDEATEEFLDTKKELKLSIGATQTLSASMLPMLLTLFHEKYPDVSLSLKTDRQEVLIDMLMKNEVDGIFIHDGSKAKNIKEVFSFNEKIALISSNEIYNLKDLTSPIILNTDKNCPYGNLIRKWINENNSNPVSFIEFDTLESIVNGVVSGLGIALLPKSILPENSALHVYDLSDNFNKVRVSFNVNTDITATNILKDFIKSLG